MNYTRKKVDGNTTYYYNNEGGLHRTDGPAIEASYFKSWWINDEMITEKQFNEIKNYPMLW